MDRSNLGHVQPGDTQIVQSFQVTNGGHIHGSPVYWNGPAGPLIYVMAEEDYLKGFHFNGTQFDTTPATMSTFPSGQGMPGGFLSVSANGSTAGSGIVWVNMPFSGDAQFAVVPGLLRAFDASDLTQELWNSQQNTLDQLGNFAKFVPPTVANGRVYMATFSSQLVVYGLLNSLPPPAGGALSASSVMSAATADLTAVGTSDWARWPGYAGKASGGSQISDVTTIGGNPSTYSNDPRTLTWSDGASPASGSTLSGIYITSIGSGFTLSAPADTTTRTLTLYVGGWNSTGKLTARLSDSSAWDVTGTELGGSNFYDTVQTITYHAASAGQRVIVQWAQVGGIGRVTLQGAALAGGGLSPPGVPANVSASDGTSTSVNVTWTAVTGATSYTVYRSTSAGTQGSALGSPTAPSFVDTTMTPGLVYYYGVTATNGGGTSALSAQNSGFAAVAPPGVPTNVAASDGTSTTSVSVTWTAVTGATSYTVYRSTSAGTQGSALGSPTAPSFVDSTVTPGTTYYYGVTATNGGGTSALSAQNSGFAAVSGGGGGSLTGAALTPTSPVNLTTVGTSDWAHWPGHDHKATGGGQLPPYTLVGAAPQNAYSDDPRTLSWSDGTPTGTGSNRQGVYTWAAAMASR